MRYFDDNENGSHICQLLYQYIHLLILEHETQALMLWKLWNEPFFFSENM